MPFPKQKEIELPLLLALSEFGGTAKPRQLYPILAARFPQLTTDEQEEKLPGSPTTRKWWNLVQWARQELVEQSEIDGSTRGVWVLTDKGRERLKREGGASLSIVPVPAASREQTLRDLANANLDEAKARLLNELKGLTPTQFEKFCRLLLEQLGFHITVTRPSGDGGIDGYGDFRQGAVSLKSAFQAKRWKENPVGRPEIDKFRGAIQGEYDHGVFITTSRFAKPAIEASYRKGAITILLLDGQEIVRRMIEGGIGVVRQPVFLHDIDPAFFNFDDV